MAGEWPTERVGDLADSISDTHKFGKDRLIFLNTSDVLLGKILHHSYSAVREWPGQAKKSIQRDDILFSEIRPANGRWAYVDVDAEDYVVSTKLMVIRPRRNRVMPRFLYHFLASSETTRWLQHLAESRSGTFPQITFDQIAELELALPSLTEQANIANFLDCIDDKIELNQRMNQTLETIAQAISKSWFMDFEPFRDRGMQDSPLGEIPKGWNITDISEIGNVICGKTPPTKDPDNYNGEIPFITIPDIYNKVFVTLTTNYLSEKGAATQSGKFLPKYSICVSCIATPGLVSITSQPSQTNQQINSIICYKNVSPFWCYFAMKNLRDEIIAGGSGGSATLNLNKGNFSKLRTIKPSPEIMQDFHEAVNPLFSRILNNECENNTLAALRDTLLPKLISGEIRVKDAERFVEKA